MPFLIDAALDAKLNYIADNGTRIDYCSQEPTTYAEATSTYTLLNRTVTAADGGGDYTVADGDASGRKLTLDAATGVAATGSGTATHWAITDGTANLIATNALSSSLALTSGANYDLAACDVLEDADATSE